MPDPNEEELRPRHQRPTSRPAAPFSGSRTTTSSSRSTSSRRSTSSSARARSAGATPARSRACSTSSASAAARSRRGSRSTRAGCCASPCPASGSTLPSAIDHTAMDQAILQTAFDVRENDAGRATIFVTMDTNLRIRADALGMVAQTYENQRVEFDRLNSGIIDLEIDGERGRHVLPRGSRRACASRRRRRTPACCCAIDRTPRTRRSAATTRPSARSRRSASRARASWACARATRSRRSRSTSSSTSRSGSSRSSARRARARRCSPSPPA